MGCLERRRAVAFAIVASRPQVAELRALGCGKTSHQVAEQARGVGGATTVVQGLGRLFPPDELQSDRPRWCQARSPRVRQDPAGREGIPEVHREYAEPVRYAARAADAGSAGTAAAEILIPCGLRLCQRRRMRRALSAILRNRFQALSAVASRRAGLGALDVVGGGCVMHLARPVLVQRKASLPKATAGPGAGGQRRYSSGKSS